jgi:hypothetical protein
MAVAMMIFVCPNCCATLQHSDLRVSVKDAMVLGNSRLCPSCGIEVCYYPDYARIIVLSTLPLLAIALCVWGVQAGLWTCVKMLVAWWFGSVWLAVMVAQLFPPRLKLANKDDDVGPFSPPSMLR